MASKSLLLLPILHSSVVLGGDEFVVMLSEQE